MKITERQIRQGYKPKNIVGIDESGICCYSGPIYAGAVILDYSKKYSKLITDCKLLSTEQLAKAYKEIKEKAIDWSTAKATVSEIDKFGTAWAIRNAMNRAYKNLKNKPDFAIIDYHNLTYLKIPQLGVPKADLLYKCVSAASIVAKYERDEEMKKCHKEYPEYHWDTNHGDFNKQHRNLIIQYGLTKFHRLSWCQSIEKNFNIKLFFRELKNK